MRKYTHRKRSYHAECVQLSEDNRQEVIDILTGEGAKCEPFMEFLMVRRDGYIHALSMGHWVVRGENEYVKCYDEETFAIKYEQLG